MAVPHPVIALQVSDHLFDRLATLERPDRAFTHARLLGSCGVLASPVLMHSTSDDHSPYGSCRPVQSLPYCLHEIGSPGVQRVVRYGTAVCSFGVGTPCRFIWQEADDQLRQLVG